MFGLGAHIPVGAKTAQKITKRERVSKDSAALLLHFNTHFNTETKISKGKSNQNMLNAHIFSIVCKAKFDKNYILYLI